MGLDTALLTINEVWQGESTNYYSIHGFFSGHKQVNVSFPVNL